MTLTVADGAYSPRARHGEGDCDRVHHSGDVRGAGRQVRLVAGCVLEDE
ncbi:hypothetical protein [Streptosporangium vulgare]